jgi:kynureninase
VVDRNANLNTLPMPSIVALTGDTVANNVVQAVPMTTTISRQDALELDSHDPLAGKRQAFVLTDGLINLDGNSLGPPSKAALAALKVAAEQEWAQGLIRSWNTAGWAQLSMTLGDRVGRLIGARPGETVVVDTTSANIFKALNAGLSLRPGRHVIVAEGDGFPTDIYIAQGVQSLLPDVKLRLQGRDAPTLEALMDEQVAVVLVNQVDYRTGVLRDMAAVTRQAHAVGAIVVWDLCHTAGALKVDLNGANADMAVGCTYKYLNGGPGAPGFVTVAERHHGKYAQPLSGWWGHAKPFAFVRDYTPGDGLRPMLCGTQPVLALRALSGALDVWDDVDLDAVRAKSLALSDLFMACVEETCGAYGVTLAAPREHARRGSQVSFRHAHGYEVMQAMAARGVIGDFRAPDFMRFGFAPLYLSYAEIYDAATHLHDILATEQWREPRFAERGAVT